MKGFVITLDSLISISFLIFALIIIASQSQMPRAPDGIYLKQLTLDTMTVLEKTGRIDDVLGGDIGAAQEIIEATPYLACMEVSLLNISGDAVTTITKSDCNETTGLDMQITSKPVLYQGDIYMIKSKSWFKKESD